MDCIVCLCEFTSCSIGGALELSWFYLWISDLLFWACGSLCLQHLQRSVLNKRMDFLFVSSWWRQRFDPLCDTFTVYPLFYIFRSLSLPFQRCPSRGSSAWTWSWMRVWSRAARRCLCWCHRRPDGWPVWIPDWTGQPRCLSDPAEVKRTLLNIDRFLNFLIKPFQAYRFAVRGRGEAGLESALPPELAADVRGLAGHSRAACRHEAAAGRADVTRTDAEQHAKTWDVLGQRYPAKRGQRSVWSLYRSVLQWLMQLMQCPVICDI